VTRALLLSSLLAAACSSKPTPGGIKLEQVTKALDSAGIKTAPLEETSPARYSALKCVTGLLDNLETLVCEYGSREAVVAGHKAAEQWAGTATTAIVLDNGLTVLACADRNRADPNGKQLNKIATAYQKLK
jgi:hypothetical protein